MNIQNTPITSNYNNQFTYENKVKQYSNNVISTSNNQQEVSFSGNFQKPTTSILEKILEPFKQYIAINSITKNIDDITSVSKTILKERAKQIERARQEAEAAAKEAAKQLRMAQYKNMNEAALKQAKLSTDDYEESEVINKYLNKLQTERFSKLSPEKLGNEIKTFEKAEKPDYNELKLAKDILKDKGYIVYHGKVVSRTSLESHAPLYVAPMKTPESTSAAFSGSVENYKYVQFKDVIPSPKNIKYEPMKNISFGLYGYTHSIGADCYNSPRFSTKNRDIIVTSNFADPIGEIGGKEARSWFASHSYTYDGKDISKKRYVTQLCFSAGDLTGRNRGNGFNLVMEGDVPVEKLEHLRKYFIESGTIENLNDANGTPKASEILDNMLEYTANYLNKKLP